MWNDIKMWLYLRLLDSELKNFIPRDGENENIGYGSYCCEVNKTRKFRYEENFMKKIQVIGLKVYLVILPFSLHKFFLKGDPEIKDEVISEKTRGIFESAKSFGFFDYSKQETGESKQDYSLIKTKVYENDQTRIAISYSEGNRFISWSGLISFCYKHHWQFVVLLWSTVVYFIAKSTVLLQWLCQYSKFPMC